MQATIERQHHWLQKFVGQWTFETAANMGPGEPELKSTGTEVGRSVGGIWVVVDGAGPMPDGNPATWHTTLGFDPRSGRFVGTWFGSMMTHMWVYQGSLDPSERVLTLDCDGPDFSDPTKTGKYRDIHEFVTDDHRILRGTVLGADGNWNTFMTTHYRRAQ